MQMINEITIDMEPSLYTKLINISSTIFTIIPFLCLVSIILSIKYRKKENIKELIFEHIDSDLHERTLPSGEKVVVTDEKYIELLIEEKIDKYFEDEIFIGTVDEFEEKKMVNEIYFKGQIYDALRLSG